MGEWKECTLGDAITLQRGHDLPKSKMIDEGIPVAGSNGIIGFHNTHTTNGPGVTIGRSGNLGNAYFYRTIFWAHNTTLYVKEFKGNNEVYIYYLLKSIDFKQFNVGSAVPTLNRNHIHPLKISLPPLPEQKAIAPVLSSLDDKIDLLNRQNKTLEAMAETLFRQWFIEPARRGGEADDSWETSRLGLLGKVITGKTPSTKNDEFWGEELNFITPTDFKNYNKFTISSERHLSQYGSDKFNKFVLPKGSILVTCIGSDMGKVAVSNSQCITNQQINSLIVDDTFQSPEYVYQYMKFIYPLLRSMALGGTTMPIINKSDFENIEITIPSERLLMKYQEIASKLSEKILYNTLQIISLEKLRDTLLPKLMSGEVRVKC